MNRIKSSREVLFNSSDPTDFKPLPLIHGCNDKMSTISFSLAPLAPSTAPHRNLPMSSPKKLIFSEWRTAMTMRTRSGQKQTARIAQFVAYWTAIFTSMSLVLFIDLLVAREVKHCKRVQSSLGTASACEDALADHANSRLVDKPAHTRACMPLHSSKSRLRD